MLRRHRAANGVEDRVEARLLVPLDLLNHDQLLPAVDFRHERRSAVGPQPRMALLDRPLDVLRIVVHPVDDDQVLQPAGDEQFAVPDEPQVAGAEEGPLQGRHRACPTVQLARNVSSVASGCCQ